MATFASFISRASQPQVWLRDLAIGFIGLSTLLSGGCEESKPDEKLNASVIGYEFYSSLDSTESDSIDAVAASGLDLFSRLSGESQVFAAWEEWPETSIQSKICDQLSATPTAQLFVLLDPEAYAIADDLPSKEFPFQNHQQVQLENKNNPNAGLLSPKSRAAALHLNLILATNLRPQAADDGRFTIYSSATSLARPTNSNISEAIRIYGDSSLYGRCLAYWEALRDNRTEFGFVTSHTYSNLHDHQTWFFPDQLATVPENSMRILTALETGIAQTHQPAKVRLVVSGAEICHAPFFESLAKLAVEQEIDLKIVIADTETVAIDAVHSLSALDDGNLRILAAKDSLQRHQLSSRILLIDGPYSLNEGEPSTRRRLTFFFSDDFNLTSQRQNSSIWIRIADKRVFLEAEKHWERIWALSENKPLTQAIHFGRQRRCTIP